MVVCKFMHLEAVRKKKSVLSQELRIPLSFRVKEFLFIYFLSEAISFNSDIFRVKNRNVFFSRCHHSCWHFLKGKILTFSHFSFGSIFVCGVIKHMKSKYKKD